LLPIEHVFIRGFMKQNNLYLLIGALLVAVIGLGVYVYREESKPSGVELRIDESGVSVQEN
jgi:RsiW-degrading membrane proteinase PrsW (M82 family)